ncbi:glycosyltransferase family 4 protein [Salmonella enterica]|uniref:glycosyltransferase family 4 protein n=1 Tax=Enterobacter hormaechei TaxID=158836 RepID=UPI001FFC6224|nr:glycosyltransferase family 4 protein [Enterobacter hormaechei]EIV9451190.1 glycosyltransferase family 4 protein [Salmonella enterica]MCK2094145.1 glycosyltransferase family 4 protein [Enterobacter hormaechei]
MNKKILFLVSSLKKGGPVNQLYELVSSNVFKEVCSNITIMSLSSPHLNDSRAQDFEKLGCHLESLENDSYNFLKISKCIRSFINNNSFNVVVSQGIRSDIALSLIINQIKAECYCILHNYIGPDYKLTYGKLLSKVMVSLHLYALRKLQVISVSKSVSDYVHQNYRVNSTPIKNGVRSVDCTLLYTPSNSLPKPIKLIYVGVVNKRKRVKELVDCCNALENDNIILNIAGRCESNDVNSTSRKISYLGQRDDITSLLLQHHIFVSFSAFEGLPMAALEALAMGTPCILSDIPPHREIINLSPSFGCVCEIDDPNALNYAIEYCLSINPFDIKKDFDHLLSSEVMATSYYEVLINK